MDVSSIRLMARYNEWMNAKLYEAASRLPAAALAEDRGAFFGSLLGTLNHIAVADTIWLHRFSRQPARKTALDPLREQAPPTALNQILFSDFAELRRHRGWLDAVILQWADELSEADLDQPLRYANTKGIVSTRHYGSVIQHFFNHQTHHRGQVTTLLHQAGIDPGVTDLLMLVPDEAAR